MSAITDPALEAEKRTGITYRPLDETTERVTKEKMPYDERYPTDNENIDSYAYGGDSGVVSFHSHAVLKELTRRADGSYILGRTNVPGAFAPHSTNYITYDLSLLLDDFDIYRVNIPMDNQLMIQGFDLYLELFADGLRINPKHYTTRYESAQKHFFLFVEKVKNVSLVDKHEMLIRTTLCSPYTYSCVELTKNEGGYYTVKASELGSIVSEDDIILYIPSKGYFPYMTVTTKDPANTTEAVDKSVIRWHETVCNFKITTEGSTPGADNTYVSYSDFNADQANDGFFVDESTEQAYSQSSVVYRLVLGDAVSKYVDTDPAHVIDNDPVYVINRRSAFGYNILEYNANKVDDTKTLSNGTTEVVYTKLAGLTKYSLGISQKLEFGSLLPLANNEIEVYREDGQEAYPGTDFFYRSVNYALSGEDGLSRKLLADAELFILDAYSNEIVTKPNTAISDSSNACILSRIAATTQHTPILVTTPKDGDPGAEITKVLNNFDKNTWSRLLIPAYRVLSVGGKAEFDVATAQALLYNYIILSVDGVRLCPRTDYTITILANGWNANTGVKDVPKSGDTTFGNIETQVTLTITKAISGAPSVMMRVDSASNILYGNNLNNVVADIGFKETAGAIKWVVSFTPFTPNAKYANVFDTLAVKSFITNALLSDRNNNNTISLSTNSFLNMTQEHYIGDAGHTDKYAETNFKSSISFTDRKAALTSSAPGARAAGIEHLTVDPKGSYNADDTGYLESTEMKISHGYVSIDSKLKNAKIIHPADSTTERFITLGSTNSDTGAVSSIIGTLQASAEEKLAYPLSVYAGHIDTLKNADIARDSRIIAQYNESLMAATSAVVAHVATIVKENIEATSPLVALYNIDGVTESNSAAYTHNTYKITLAKENADTKGKSNLFECNAKGFCSEMIRVDLGDPEKIAPAVFEVLLITDKTTEIELYRDQDNIHIFGKKERPQISYKTIIVVTEEGKESQWYIVRRMFIDTNVTGNKFAIPNPFYVARQSNILEAAEKLDYTATSEKSEWIINDTIPTGISVKALFVPAPPAV